MFKVKFVSRNCSFPNSSGVTAVFRCQGTDSILMGNIIHVKNNIWFIGTFCLGFKGQQGWINEASTGEGKEK